MGADLGEGVSKSRPRLERSRGLDWRMVATWLSFGADLPRASERTDTEKASECLSMPCWPAVTRTHGVVATGVPPRFLRGGGQTAGDPQGRRRPVHPGRSGPLGEERRHRPRSGARDVHRRKRQAAPHGGRVSAWRRSRHPLARWNAGRTASQLRSRARRHTVGMVPPSMTISVPVIVDARSEATNATSSATSSGRFGRPNGMPPSMSISRCRAVA
jgi:hypothetical protein